MKKLGKGYYQAGYGRGFKKTGVVRVINGKAYVKDSTATPFETDIKGYVMVNRIHNSNAYYEVSLISEHEKVTK